MAMLYLYSKSIKFTPLSILEVLSSEEARKSVESLGGLEYLSVLETVNLPDESLNLFINKVKQSYTRRKLWEISNDVASFVLSDDAEVLNPSELIGHVESKLTDLSVNTSSSEEVYKMGSKTEEVLAERATHPAQIPGLETGWAETDRLTNGGQPGDLIIVCAPSKTGKSVTLTNWANKFAIHDRLPILYIDTEMNEREQEDRLLANLSGIPLYEITSGLYVMDTEHGSAEDKIKRIKYAQEKLNMGNYYHIYMPQFTIEKVTSLARKFQMQFGIVALFFDYIKIPSSASSSFKNMQEYQSLGFFTSGLKDIAGILRIPVYSACQTNRNDTSGDEPSEKDIGGSYRILQLASKLMFLYNKSPEKIEKDGVQNGNQQLFIKWQRNGESDCPPINIFFDRPIIRQQEV